jgi:hypothetical protein
VDKILAIMTAEQEELIIVLLETRKLIELPDSDFVWSGWDGRQEALAAFDKQVDKIKNADYTALFDLSILYAPTGQLQELSISNGWTKPFLELSARFDQALLRLQNQIKQ